MEDRIENAVIEPKRDCWLDNIKGILMIAVVVGHMIAQISKASDAFLFLYNAINTFHMGAFMILTGYLSKRRIEQKDYFSIINKNIIPYITAQMVLYFTAVIIPEGLRASNATYFNRSSFSFLIPIFQLWFLVAITLYVLVSAKIQPKRHPILFMLGAIAASLICGYLQQVNVLKITKVIGFYPFFLLGYLTPKDFLMKIRKKWWCIAIAVVVWIGYLYFMAQGEWTAGLGNIFGLSTRYVDCDPLFLNLPAIAGRLVFLLAVPVVAFAFYVLCPRKQCIFTKLGQNSRYIFVLHSLVVVPLRCLQYKYNYISLIHTKGQKCLFLLLCIVITFVLGCDWIKKLTKSILEPDIDIVEVTGTLNERYLKKKNKQ